MAAKLINGNGFTGVSAQVDADFYEGLFGTETSILATGQRMRAEIVDNNPRIYDGVILTKEGRRIQIDYGTYVDFTIPEGTAGVTAYYIIGFKLVTGADDKQTCEPFVRAIDSPTGTIAEARLKDGNSEVYISVYRVIQTGLTNTLLGRLAPILVNSMLDKFYPIGAIYMSMNNTNPADLFGGTWQQISGRFLLAADSTYEAGSTGGEATHTLTAEEMPSHTHIAPKHRHAVANHTHTIPAHTHTASSSSAGAHTHAMYRWKYATPTAGGTGYLAQGSSKDTSYGMSSAGAHTHTITIGTKAAFSTSANGNMDTTMNGDSATTSAGSSGAHNNMPPYLAVYMWKRTA